MRTYRFRVIALAAAFVAGLAGCGGGGGGGGGPPPVAPTIDIAAPNRDSVAHAAAASILAMSPSGAIPLAAGASASALAVRALRQRVEAFAVDARAQRKVPLAVLGPFVTPCVISGTVTETDDDRDNNNLPSVGDVVTLVYNNCQDTAGETLNGSMTMTLTQVSVMPVPSGSAQVTVAQMSMVAGNHSMTLNGSMRVDVTLPSASVETVRITADGPVTVGLSIAHLGYSDTLTLQSGFFEEDSHDATLARTVSTVSGHLQSANAGGIVEVGTLTGAPITKLDSDFYPSAGVLQARGRNSTLRVTALSAAAARLDLDADGNGTFEATQTVNWDWLL
jgi:hypothetical protein